MRSPVCSASTASIPATTRPNAVRRPSHRGCGDWVMKNRLLPVSGRPRASPTVPRRKGSWFGSSRRVNPAPPVPSLRGSPPYATSPGTTRWNVSPSKKPRRASVMKLSAVSGASSTASSISIVPCAVSTYTRGEKRGFVRRGAA